MENNEPGGTITGGREVLSGLKVVSTRPGRDPVCGGDVDKINVQTSNRGKVRIEISTGPVKSVLVVLISRVAIIE